MLSTVFLSVLAAATLTSAAPALEDKRGLDCAGTGAYYVCYKNGFRGHCSTDPCDQTWCADYEANTCTKKAGPVVPSDPWTPPPTVAECSGAGAYYVCANNGFRGSCSVDPCAVSWCPDYETKTCTKKAGPIVPSDPWTPPPTVAECSGAGAYYVCANNGFRGACSVDPCALSWCPDFEAKTCTKKTTWTPPKTNTPPPAEKPKTSTPPPAEKPKTGPSDPTVCAAGTGYYQVCASGFKGCCKQDACSLGYCPAS